MAEFDVIVFGATGFTGKLICEYLAKHYAGSARWAMGGRSESKLLAARDEVAQFEPAVRDAPLVVADSGDRAQLDAMAARCRVVLTTVGPYTKYGSELVAACVAAGTHYVDLTGEASWIKVMLDRHHAEAQRTGAKIVPSCGFDSIPSDLGFLMMGEAMKARGRECESVLYVQAGMRGGASGGTLDTLFTLFGDTASLKAFADPYLLNEGDRPPASGVPPLFVGYNSTFGRWTAPFFMAGHNTKVVRRTHKLLGFRFGRGCRYEEVMGMRGLGGLLMALLVSIAMPLGALLLFFAPTRALVQYFAPKPGQGATRAERDAGFFNTLFEAKAAGAPALTLRGRVRNREGDPGYKCTALMISEAALCLALDGDRLPPAGGLLTPASAMGEVLSERLRAKGMEIELLP